MGLIITTLGKYFLLAPVILLLTIENGVLQTTRNHSCSAPPSDASSPFAMTGMTIVVVPIYQAETAPETLWGLITSSLQLMILLGSLVASLVPCGTSSMKTSAAWHIPVALQLLVPAFLLATWFWVASPADEATKYLRRNRTDKSEEDIGFEIQDI
ncbi:hexose transporter 2 [Fusarium sp. NRRL 25303]|nr:hexose transporter 2 [Fusarium sp. NRRL 25303]